MPASSVLACIFCATFLVLASPCPPASPSEAGRDGGGEAACGAASSPPTIDGTLSAGEWSSANSSLVTLNGFNNPARTITAQWYYMNDGSGLYVALDFSVATDFLVLDIDDKEDHVGKDGGEDYIRVDAGYSDRYWSQGAGDWLSDAGGGGTTDGSGKRDLGTRVYEASKPLASGDPRDFSAQPGTRIGFRMETYSGGDFYRYPANTVDHDLNFNGKLDDEMLPWLDLVLVETGPNAPPVLSDGKVLPPEGNTSTTFSFSVLYTDAEGAAPACSTVVIDGTAFNMTSTGTDYGAGANFTYHARLGSGGHAFFFNFSDGRDGARFPAQGSLDGPLVEPSAPPTLRNGTVEPAEGAPGTLFRYSVSYNDTNGDPPILHRLYIDNSSRDMTAGGTDFREGVAFTFETVVPEGSHAFHFLFSDLTGSVRLPASGEFPGPLVTVPNTLPVLTCATVSPSEGEEGRVFSYSVKYWDAEDDPPRGMTVLLDNGTRGFPMTEADPLDLVFSDGKDYRFDAKGPALLKGNVYPHDFLFTAQDREGSGTVATEVREGPLVKWRRAIGSDSWMPAAATGTVCLAGDHRTFLAGAGAGSPDAPENLTLAGTAFVLNTTAPPELWFWANITVRYSAWDPLGIDEPSLRAFRSAGGAPYAPLPLSGTDLETRTLWFNVTEPGGTFALFARPLLPKLVVSPPRPDISSPREGQTVNWSVTVGNEGRVESGAENLTWSLDGAAVSSERLGPLKPGWTDQARWSWKAVRGHHALEVRFGGSTSSAEVEVAANLPPTARINASALTVQVKKQVRLSAEPSADPDGTIVSFEWDLGNGERRNGTVVTASYSKSGSYAVVLTVTDDLGSRANASVLITVKAAPGKAPGGAIPGLEAGPALAACALLFLLAGRRSRGARASRYGPAER